MLPLTTHSGRTGGKIRLYSEPMFIPDAGILRPINDLLRVQYNDSLCEFVISYGDEWIAFRPLDLTGFQTCLLLARTRGRRFGWFLDATKKPDSIEWIVEHTNGVQRTAWGWMLGSPGGVPLGLSVSDWLSRFGGLCALKDNRVTLDLSGVAEYDPIRDKLIKNPIGGVQPANILDLDPVTVNTSGWKSYDVYTEDPDPWTTARDSATGTVGTSMEPWGDSDDSTYAYIKRLALQFDTSAYPSILAAKFWIYFDWDNSTDEPDKAGVCRADGVGLLTDATNYAKIKTGYGSAFAGYLVGTDIDPQVDQWAYRDILSIYQSAAALTLGMGYYNDIEDSPGDDPTNTAYDSGYTPYLEITPLPGGSSTTTTTTAANRRGYFKL